MQVKCRNGEQKSPLVFKQIPKYQQFIAQSEKYFNLDKKQWIVTLYDEQDEEGCSIQHSQDYDLSVDDYKQRKAKTPLMANIDIISEKFSGISSIVNGNEQQEKNISGSSSQQRQLEQVQNIKEQKKSAIVDQEEEKQHGQIQREEEEEEEEEGSNKGEIQKKKQQQQSSQEENNSKSSSSSDSEQVNQPNNENPNPTNNQAQSPELTETTKIINIQAQPQIQQKQIQPQQVLSHHQPVHIKGEQQQQCKVQDESSQSQSSYSNSHQQQEQKKPSKEEISQYSSRQLRSQIKKESNAKQQIKQNASSCSFCYKHPPHIYHLNGFNSIKTCQKCEEEWQIQSKKRRFGVIPRKYLPKRNKLHQQCSFCGQRQEAMFKVGKFDIQSCIPCRQKWQIVPIYNYIYYQQPLIGDINRGK